MMPLHPTHFPGPEVTTSVFADAEIFSASRGAQQETLWLKGQQSLPAPLSAVSLRRGIRSATARRVQPMVRICPGLPVKVCLAHSARILKDRAVWPESLQEMKTRL